jgi:hypothetical protein
MTNPAAVLKKQQVLKELQTIPSIGKACAVDLWNIGIRSVSDLHKKDPELLYHKLNAVTGRQHDICMLYTFRCAVYYATEKNPKSEKLKWWWWKDRTLKY